MTLTAMPGLTRSERFRGWLTAARRFCFGSLAGLLILAGSALKAATFGLWTAGLGGATGVQAASTLGGVALLAGAGILLVRLTRRARTQLLWRVRRKLIISYLFIGFVPAILIVIFFVLSGLLLFANLSSYLIRASLTDLADEATSVARLAAVELESRDREAAVRIVLARRAAAARDTLAGISLAAVPLDPGRCESAGASSPRPAAAPIIAGEWRHGAAPAFLPAWVPCAGFAGVLAGGAGSGPVSSAAGAAAPGAEMFVRAVLVPGEGRGVAVVVDVPVAGAIKRRIEETTGITIGGRLWRQPRQPAGPGASSGWSCWTTSTGSPARRNP